MCTVCVIGSAVRIKIACSMNTIGSALSSVDAEMQSVLLTAGHDGRVQALSVGG